jgi:hypothetical protein
VRWIEYSNGRTRSEEKAEGVAEKDGDAVDEERLRRNKKRRCQLEAGMF